jgi:TPR repeat protein
VPKESETSGTRAPHGFGDLIPSPHDHPIVGEEELRKAERLCIADLPYQCMRVADVYAAGELVPADARRHNQYRNLAFRLYIKQCESHAIEACYSLARMYLRGDGVKANPAYAQNLMRRVLELCGYKRVKLCERLESEAPEVIQRYKDKPAPGTQ